MKGLILNQYYAIGNSVRNYFVLSIFLAAVFLFTQNEWLLTFAAFVPIIFMVSPALEVLKHESKSGWNKFVLTLPLKRSHVVKSHYLFFIMLMFIGLFIVIGVFVVAELLLENILVEQAIYWMMNGVGVAFVLGFIAYPLTYLLGSEKSDMILMVSVIAGVGLFFLSSWLYEQILINVSPYVLQGLNHDMLFSAGFLVITLVLFIVSYVIALQVYKRKEF
ncbi:ABC-2 transporter permease [Natribacillus halophilus]|uniref:ABC-2 family transporter protein n=1 Tax=Natribacillus halophilus TaxID=549003 RepID=A0A1G8SM48_9BACI|nr:ABC-2 transporter permease [Natribacillus halophilus]SDJ29690.1 ABC-2 family transporter protein [Natribacillus halophilus]